MHLEAVGVVHQPVENAVGQSRVPDLLVPLGHGELAGEDRRACLIAVLTDFQEVPPLAFRQRRMGPVIDDQHVNAGQPSQPGFQAAIGAGQGQVAKQSGSADEESGKPSRQAFSPRAQASQLFPTPQGPNKKIF